VEVAGLMLQPRFKGNSMEFSSAGGKPAFLMAYVSSCRYLDVLLICYVLGVFRFF